MKLYCHPASTTSRMIMQFAADQGIDLEYKTIDIFTGEHYKPEFTAINPNNMVPVLEDGDFRLTESSAILKHIADSRTKLADRRYPAFYRPMPQRGRDYLEAKNIEEAARWLDTLDQQ